MSLELSPTVTHFKIIGTTLYIVLVNQNICVLKYKINK